MKYKNMRSIPLIILLLIGSKVLSQDSTFYDLKWVETQREKAEYYRVISKLDSLWSIKDYFIDNRLQMTGTLLKPNHLARHGDFKWYNEEGNFTQSGHYKNGEKDGELVFYFDNGEVETIENYSNGILHGPFQSYFTNGQIATTGRYIDGTLDGVVESWYENGQLKSHIVFAMGNRSEAWIFYNTKGKVTDELLFQTKYEIIKNKLVFEIPCQEWYRDHFQNKNGIRWYSFKRDPIENKNGIKIYPNISFLIEETGSLDDVILFSAQKRQSMPFNVDKVFTYQDSDLKLKNAIGYLGNTIYEDGSAHTVLIVHALVDKKGIQIVMDMTSDIFEDFGNEFKEALKGICLVEQAP